MPHHGSRHATYSQSYDVRAQLPNTPELATYLFNLMAKKKSNLCLSADVTSSKEILELAEELGDEICMFKTHCDVINDFSVETMLKLEEIAKRKDFLIFEDRKLGDIGNTVKMQYTSGPLQIARWANIVNAHIFPGPAVIKSVADAAVEARSMYGLNDSDSERPSSRGLLILAQMSSAGNLMDEHYTKQCIEVARQHPDFVIGFIAQHNLNKEPHDNFISMAPGVQLESKGDAQGQQYNTPDTIIGKQGVDVAIVGRGIYTAPDRKKAAQQYRELSWAAYETRTKSSS